jgi:hypothetical protein
MAKLIPSGVVNLPNFAELQYNLNRQRQADELAVAKDVAQFKQREGIIAPGAMPLVQSEFDNWQELAKKYAADPSAANYTALSGAYDKYSKAHGTAKFLFDTVKERDAKYYSDPTKWGISSDQYSADSDGLIRNRYNSFEELMTAASNVSELSPRKDVNFSTAEQWVSSRLTPSWEKVYPSLDINGTGRVTKQQRDEWFEQAFTGQVESNEDSRKEAILGEVQRQGRFGLNKDGSPINLTQEQINEVFSSPELSAKYFLDYKNRSKAIFDQDAALEYVTPYASRKDVRDYNLQIAKLYGDRDKEFTGVPQIYLTPEKQAMVALPAPIKIGDRQIYQFGVDAAGNKYLYTSQKNELGQEVQSVVKATDQEFKSAESIINKEFKNPSFFSSNLELTTKTFFPKDTEVVSEMAKETPMSSARELEVQFRADQALIGQMTGGIRRSPQQAANPARQLVNKYPDAFTRSGLDLNNLTVEDVDRFAEEIAADHSGSVTKAKGAEKAITVSKKSAQETKEYDKLSALTFKVGPALGVRQLPEETSDKYFERIKGKASEIMSDTYRSQGVYKSKSGNEENARLRRILEFGTPTNRGALYQEASRAYNDFIDAVEELESARK